MTRHSLPFFFLSFSGGSCRQPVWHPGLSVRGAVSELADPGATVAGVRKAAGHLSLLILLWPAPLDRQLCPHLWFCVRILPVLCLPALHQVGEKNASSFHRIISTKGVVPAPLSGSYQHVLIESKHVNLHLHHVCFSRAKKVLLNVLFSFSSFGRSDMYRKRVQICVFLLVFLGLLSTLAVLFYVYPVKCEWCEYLTCIPIMDKFCEKYDLNAHIS